MRHLVLSQIWSTWYVFQTLIAKFRIVIVQVLLTYQSHICSISRVKFSQRIYLNHLQHERSCFGYLQYISDLLLALISRFSFTQFLCSEEIVLSFQAKLSAPLDDLRSGFWRVLEYLWVEISCFDFRMSFSSLVCYFTQFPDLIYRFYRY